MDLLGQNRSHDRMVQGPETVGDVALDEPHRPVPLVIDLLQGGVTAAARAEPVGAVGELRLVVRLQDQAQYLLQQLVRPGRQPQRSLFHRILLLDVSAPYRGPSVTLLPERLDDGLDLAEVHAIHGLAGGSGGQRPLVTVELPIGKQEQVRVEQAPVDPFQRQSSPAAFTNDLQYGCGVSYLAYLTVLVDLSTWVPSPM